jgi:hypothetical protein
VTRPGTRQKQTRLRRQRQVSSSYVLLCSNPARHPNTRRTERGTFCGAGVGSNELLLGDPAFISGRTWEYVEVPRRRMPCRAAITSPCRCIGLPIPI